MTAMRRHLFAALLLSLLATSGLALLVTLSPARPGDLIVAFAPATSPERALAAIVQSGASVQGDWLGGRLWHVAAPDEAARRRLIAMAPLTFDARLLEPLLIASGCGWAIERRPRGYSAA